MIDSNIKINNRINLFTYGFLLLYSFVIKFFTSYYSILFDKSTFIEDGAIFYSVGRMIMNGKILYKEAFDNKTPYLHLIYGIGSLLKERHLGLYIIDVLLFFIIVVFIYKILKLYNYKYSLYIVLFMSLFLTNLNFTQGIFKSETCALASFVPAVYIFAKYYKIGNICFKLRDMFVIGILAGFAFMTNIRAIVLFVPFALVVAYKLIINKKYINLILIIIMGLLGVFIACLPYIIYAFYTNSFKDFYESVIFNNIQYNATNSQNLTTRMNAIIKLLKTGWFIVLFTIYSLISIFLIKFDKFFKISIIISYLIGIYYNIFTGSAYLYNLVILIPFYAFGIIFIINNLSKKVNLFDEKISLKNCLITIFILLFAICPQINRMIVFNKNCISRSKRMMAQINEAGIDIQKSKVLAFAFNPLIYTYLDKVPDFKYFYGPSIDYKLDPAPAEGQVNYIVNKEPDIIIMYARLNETRPNIPKSYEYKHALKVTLSVNQNYHLICRYKMNEADGSYLVFARNNEK